MPTPNRHVDDRRRFRQLRSPREHPADPQIFFSSEAQHNARVKRRRRKERAQTRPHIGVDVKFLFRLTPVHRSLWFGPRAALRKVRIAYRASAARARDGRLTAKKPPNSSRNGNTKHRPLIEV